MEKLFIIEQWRLISILTVSQLFMYYIVTQKMDKIPTWKNGNVQMRMLVEKLMKLMLINCTHGLNGRLRVVL